jgi:hypothetical protein
MDTLTASLLSLPAAGRLPTLSLAVSVCFYLKKTISGKKVPEQVADLASEKYELVDDKVFFLKMI